MRALFLRCAVAWFSIFGFLLCWQQQRMACGGLEVGEIYETLGNYVNFFWLDCWLLNTYSYIQTLLT